MKRTKIRLRPSCFCFIAGCYDSWTNRVYVKDGNPKSNFIMSCAEKANACVAITWKEAIARISSIDERIRKNKYSITRLRYNVEVKDQTGSPQDARNRARLAGIELENMALQEERNKIIRQTLEEVSAIKYIYEAKQVEPYLRGVARKLAPCSYSITIDDMPFQYVEEADGKEVAYEA